MLANCLFQPDDKADVLKIIRNDVKSCFSNLARRTWTSNRQFTASTVFIVEDSQSPQFMHEVGGLESQKL